MNERLARLEERLAWLERHVTEQDRAMLAMSDELAALRREVQVWRERWRTAEAAPPPDENDERPPHY